MNSQPLPLKKYKIFLHILIGIILIIVQALTLISFGWSQAAVSNQLYSTAIYFFISIALPVGVAFVWHQTGKGHPIRAFLFYLIPLSVYVVVWAVLITLYIIKT